MKNKKANIPITILVFLVLSLFLTSILVTYSAHQKIFGNYDLSKIQKVNSNKLLLEQNVYVISKSALAKTFDEFSKGEEYDYVKDRRSTGEFFELHGRFEENFEKRFRENFLEILNSHNTYKKELLAKYVSLGNGNFQTNFEGDYLKMNFTYFSEVEQDDLVSSSILKNLPFFGSSNDDSSIQKIISLDYRTPVEISFNFESIGLHSFEKIYIAKEICKNFEEELEMKSCFETYLINFDAIVKNVSEYYDSVEEFPFEVLSSFEGAKLVTLNSKTRFSFDNVPEPISIYFVPV